MENSNKTKYAWKSTTGLLVTVDPFLNSGYKFIYMELSEVLGGKISQGKIGFQLSGSQMSLSSVTDLYYLTITLKQEGGVQYEIKGFITDRQYLNNDLTIEFICVPDKKFYTDPLSFQWTDITQALKSLWNDPTTTDFRCESDIGNDITLFQNNETNHRACTRLSYSFKRNTVFAFGLEGFMIKDLVDGIDSQGNTEPSIVVIGDNNISQTSDYYLSYNYKLYKEIYNPYEAEETEEDLISKNISLAILGDSYYMCHSKVRPLLENYMYNTSLMNSKLYNSFTIVQPGTLPDYKLGDVVYYSRLSQDSKNPWSKFLVSGMSFFISTDPEHTDKNGLTVSFTTTLRGLEENGNTMNTEDPGIKEE